jgi:hypothetical protein
MNLPHLYLFEVIGSFIYSTLGLVGFILCVPGFHSSNYWLLSP